MSWGRAVTNGPANEDVALIAKAVAKRLIPFFPKRLEIAPGRGREDEDKIGPEAAHGRDAGRFVRRPLWSKADRVRSARQGDEAYCFGEGEILLFQEVKWWVITGSNRGPAD